MDYFVTSDTHFGHANIIKYCSRPFKDVVKMNESIIARWNMRVKPGDIVYHLGDFCFYNSKGAEERGEGVNAKFNLYWDRLNGIKFLIQGNHDRNNTSKTRVNMMVIEFGGHTIGLIHRPEDIVTKYPSVKVNYWIAGHVHNSWPRAVQFKGRTVINASMEVWDYHPAKLQEIDSWVFSKKFILKDAPADHHSDVD